MSIHELLSKIPAEEVQVQNLEQGDFDVQKTRDGTRISFYTGATTPEQLAQKNGPMCLMLWLPRERVREALRKGKE